MFWVLSARCKILVCIAENFHLPGIIGGSQQNIDHTEPEETKTQEIRKFLQSFNHSITHKVHLQINL